jgi:hypothetical protein
MQIQLSHDKLAFKANGRSLGALRQPRDDKASARASSRLGFELFQRVVDNGQRGMCLFS